MPKAVVSGQWQWPLMPVASKTWAKGPGLEASQLSQQAQVQHRLWEAVCKEEIGPLVDEALQDLAQQRTPGTLLCDYMQAAAGRPTEITSSRGSAEDLRRNNLELKERVCALQVGAYAPGLARTPQASNFTFSANAWVFFLDRRSATGKWGRRTEPPKPSRYWRLRSGGCKTT